MLNRRALLFLVTVIVGTCSVAAADPLALNLTSITANGSNFDWHYTLTLSAPPPASTVTEQMSPGDFVSVLDFTGFVAASFVTNNTPTTTWAITTELLTPLPLSGPILPANDSASVINVKFTLKTPLAGVLGPSSIADFIITSTFGKSKLGNFGAAYESDSGNPIANGGTLHPADGVIPTLVPTPEPWNVVSVLAMLVPLGLLYKGLRSTKHSGTVQTA